jgi:hypothetical protein
MAGFGSGRPAPDASLSSRGLGRRPFKAVTRVRIPSGTPNSLAALGCLSPLTVFRVARRASSKRASGTESPGCAGLLTPGTIHAATRIGRHASTPSRRRRTRSRDPVAGDASHLDQPDQGEGCHRRTRAAHGATSRACGQSNRARWRTNGQSPGTTRSAPRAESRTPPRLVPRPGTCVVGVARGSESAGGIVDVGLRHHVPSGGHAFMRCGQPLTPIIMATSTPKESGSRGSHSSRWHRYRLAGTRRFTSSIQFSMMTISVVGGAGSLIIRKRCPSGARS